MSSKQDAWIERVLGVRVGFAGSDGAKPRLQRAIAAYSAASEQVDQQIGRLQAVLRQAPDEELNDIAEYGLNGLTANHRVRLQAALVGIAAGTFTQQQAQATANLVQSYADHVGSDERFAACDRNPFGVAMTLRDTLGSGLRALQDALQVA